MLRANVCVPCNLLDSEIIPATQVHPSLCNLKVFSWFGKGQKCDTILWFPWIWLANTITAMLNHHLWKCVRIQFGSKSHEIASNGGSFLSVQLYFTFVWLPAVVDLIASIHAIINFTKFSHRPFQTRCKRPSVQVQYFTNLKSWQNDTQMEGLIDLELNLPSVPFILLWRSVMFSFQASVVVVAQQQWIGWLSWFNLSDHHLLTGRPLFDSLQLNHDLYLGLSVWERERVMAKPNHRYHQNHCYQHSLHSK